jgi:AraC-like DNA-binding protein
MHSEMKYAYHKPNTLLKEYVRTVLILEGSPGSDASIPPLFTNGMPALLCRTEKDKTGYDNIVELALFGKSIPPDRWTINNRTTIIAYFFKPFALASIFNIAAKKLLEAPIEVCTSNPHTYNSLKTQLLYSDSTSRKIDVLDNLLIQQLKHHRRECEIIHYATDQIMCRSDKEILSFVQDTLNVNTRTFQRIFKKYVGVTSVQYRRICQFQLSFAHLRIKQFEKISDLAFDNGFSDQSHFIRSFKEFTKTTPKEYLERGLPNNNS